MKQRHTVALCGECADEIFGGYPWFHRREMCQRHPVPLVWQPGLAGQPAEAATAGRTPPGGVCHPAPGRELGLCSQPARRGRGNPADAAAELFEYALVHGHTAGPERPGAVCGAGWKCGCPTPTTVSPNMCSTPPWEFKCPHGESKGLLRDAAQGLLPDEVLRTEKEAPYPETHNPGYEAVLKRRLGKVLQDSAQPIHKLLSEETVRGLLDQSFDYGKPCVFWPR